MQIMDFTFLDKMRKGKMAGPAWLTHVASDAQVEVTCLNVMKSFISPDNGGSGLKEVIDGMIGNYIHVDACQACYHL